MPEQKDSITPPQNQHNFGQHYLQSTDTITRQPSNPGVNLESGSYHLDNNAEKLVAFMRYLQDCVPCLEAKLLEQRLASLEKQGSCDRHNTLHH